MSDRKTILLTDDEPFIRLAETKILEQEGYRVIGASSGKKAIELIKGNSHIDLILMDINLGKDMDGEMAAREILKIKNLPIVFLSAYSDKETVEKVKNITRYGYVLKGSGDFVLISSIEMAFELFETTRKVQVNEEELSAIYNNAPLIMILVDREWKIRKTNAFTAQFVKASELEITGLRCGEALRCIHAVDTPEGCGYGPSCKECKLRLSVINTIETGESCNDKEVNISRFVGEDEHREIFLLSTTRLTLGEQPIVLVSMHDISDRKQSERKIIESEQAQRAILQASPIGIGRIHNRSFEWVNEYMCTITRYSYSEMQGKNVRFLYSDEEEYNRAGNALYQEGQVETKWVGKDGVTKDVFLQIAQTSSYTYIVTVSDITVRKQLESQLIQSQKMEAIGTLAGGVAHDFNNLLTVMSGYASLLAMEMDDDNPKKNYVDQILTASEKAAQLTHSLLAFSRKQQIHLKPISTNDTIKNITKLLRRLLTEDIELRTILSEENFVIMADASQIDQIFINLATNARDAMPKGGTLSIETKTVTLDNEFTRIHGYGEPGKYALLSVSDTGVGMDETTTKRIFDPFFTTKDLGKGTGLGLSIVYGAVKQHNGHITVYSEPGHGTTFRIYVPLVDLEREQETAPTREIEKGTETILIAEDDKGIRAFVAEALERFGYIAIEAVDGEDAIRVFMENKEKIDLIILDVVMPKKNGKEVYDIIRNHKPDMKFLHTSGYTADVLFDKGIHDDAINFISKPVSANELLDKIREVLNK